MIHGVNEVPDDDTVILRLETARAIRGMIGVGRAACGAVVILTDEGVLVDPQYLQDIGQRRTSRSACVYCSDVRSGDVNEAILLHVFHVV